MTHILGDYKCMDVCLDFRTPGPATETQDGGPGIKKKQKNTPRSETRTPEGDPKRPTLRPSWRFQTGEGGCLFGVLSGFRKRGRRNGVTSDFFPFFAVFFRFSSVFVVFSLFSSLYSLHSLALCPFSSVFFFFVFLPCFR